MAQFVVEAVAQQVAFVDNFYAISSGSILPLPTDDYQTDEQTGR